VGILVTHQRNRAQNFYLIPIADRPLDSGRQHERLFGSGWLPDSCCRSSECGFTATSSIRSMVRGVGGFRLCDASDSEWAWPSYYQQGTNKEQPHDV